jgi:hypothetical protein
MLVEQRAREAIEGASKEILEIFKKDYVQKMVYDSHGKNVRYYADTGRPTGEFKDAWEWTPIERNINSLVTELFYNPELMSFDASKFLHGSKYGDPQDATGDLDVILNKAGRSSSLWLSVDRPVAYFDEFIREIFDSGEMKRILVNHFVENGFIEV